MGIVNFLFQFSKSAESASTLNFRLVISTRKTTGVNFNGRNRPNVAQNQEYILDGTQVSQVQHESHFQKIYYLMAICRKKTR